MKTIDGIEIEDNKDAILKSKPAWGNTGSAARPILNKEYQVEGKATVKGTGTIGDWDGIALSADSKVIVVSPNTLTSRHYVNGEEKFLDGGSFKTAADVLDALGSRVVFTSSKAVATDKFQSTEKQFKTFYVCVKK